jgi:hypothetical protein
MTEYDHQRLALIKAKPVLQVTPEEIQWMLDVIRRQQNIIRGETGLGNLDSPLPVSRGEISRLPTHKKPKGGDFVVEQVFGGFFFHRLQADESIVGRHGLLAVHLYEALPESTHPAVGDWAWYNRLGGSRILTRVTHKDLGPNGMQKIPGTWHKILSSTDPGCIADGVPEMSLMKIIDYAEETNTKQGLVKLPGIN